MSLLLSLWPYLLAGGAALFVLWKAYRAGQNSSDLKHAAQERDAYEKHLQDIAAAADARNHVDPSGVPNDPNNRDR